MIIAKLVLLILIKQVFLTKLLIQLPLEQRGPVRTPRATFDSPKTLNHEQPMVEQKPY